MNLQLQLKLLFCLLMCLSLTAHLFAQKKLPVIEATVKHAVIQDGENVKLDWNLEPSANPDIYYVNIPHKKSIVKLITDKDEISFKTKYGGTYDFVVLLNGKDRCLIRIVAKEQQTTLSMQSKGSLPQTIPFNLIGSRIYLQGKLNGQKDAAIQLDLGAGTSAVNKNSVEKLGLSFTGKTSVSNTQGVNEASTSPHNDLTIAALDWKGVSLIEVGNMKPDEDLIIGNGLFRNKILEIDYDKKILVVHDKLPEKAKDYVKQPVFFEQDRPKFKADFIQDGKKYSFWFLFDTGRDGTMLIGEDFTGQTENWKNLKELQLIQGRKIVRLDAFIGGIEFKDVVTNAADPSKPAGRPTLFGNQILNHFNVILDNRDGFIYLKPNSRTNEPYANYEKYLKDISKQ